MNLIIIIGIFILFAAWNIWWSSPQNIGKRGERRVARKLDWLSKEYITLNDLLLPTRYGTTQIDHVVVSPYGIFVIETKNYKGWIFGHENSEEWKQSLLGKRDFGVGLVNSISLETQYDRTSSKIDTICCRFVIFTPINRNLCIGHNLIQERNQSIE